MVICIWCTCGAGKNLLHCQQSEGHCYTDAVLVDHQSHQILGRHRKMCIGPFWQYASTCKHFNSHPQSPVSQHNHNADKKYCKMAILTKADYLQISSHLGNSVQGSQKNHRPIRPKTFITYPHELTTKQCNINKEQRRTRYND